VLAFGKALRDKLLATGRYEVLMTRESDKFVDLDERREFARRHGAALFLAIHADYVPTGNHVRGATIYSLRSSVANSMSRALRRNNGSDLLAGVELEAIKNTDTDTNTLKSILADLAAREAKPTKDKTNFFAKNVIEYMGQTTEMKPDPHREAAFRVLKSAEVPSVLIELAYVSNRQDAENLKSVAWRERVSTSIANAVARYFNFASLPL
jgi:N-acetylmuramoyl-L-alanine amidase